MDGLLESYPWRGPLSLDFKPFTLQLQGTVPQLLLRLCSNNCAFVLVIKPPDVLFFRELRVADRQREESPPSLLSFIPSPVLRTLLPGRRPPHPCSPSLRQGLHHLAHLPPAQQSLLLPGSRQTERPAPAGSSNRPPAPLGAACKETSPLQGPMSSRVSGELPLPLPPPRPPQPSGAFPPPSSL